MALPLSAYQKQREAAVPRIEMVLTLYDRALTRIDRAAAAVERANTLAAQTAANECQLIVSALATGMIGQTDELSLNFLRLYEFVTNKLKTPDAACLADARKILSTLREGMEAAREEALRLEREGQIPPMDRAQMVSARA